MFRDDDDDKTIYKVVLNHEKQYSIWPKHRPNALGWEDEGKEGLKRECLEYIDKVWTDMRPLSLQLHMAEMEKRKRQGPDSASKDAAVASKKKTKSARRTTTAEKELVD